MADDKEKKMKKAFKLEDLDCAACAAKMEAAIAKLPGVKSCSINYMAQKMILEAEDAEFDSVVKASAKLIKDVEPDCTLVL